MLRVAALPPRSQTGPTRTGWCRVGGRVLFDCSAIPDFEYTALKILTEAERMLVSQESFYLAALNPEPLRLIQKSALGKTLGRQRMHFNLEEAVRAFQARPTDSKSSAAA